MNKSFHSSDSEPFLGNAGHVRGMGVPVSVWYLVGQLQPSESVRHIPLNAFPFTIGRRSDLSLSLPSQMVSGVHAEIVQRGNSIFVRDLHSTNGTYRNGIPVVDEVELIENDLLQISHVAFRIERKATDLSPQTVAGDAGDAAVALVQFDKLFDGNAARPFFQPIVELASERVVGYEVVARSRLFGLKSPEEMFRVAAQLNLQADLSRLFRRAGVEAARPLSASVNMFLNTHPCEVVHSALIESLHALREAAPHRKMTLEIHESAVADTESMHTLRAVLDSLNFRLAYDDFGAGQARLVELVEVRPDFLKFDIQLIRGIDAAPAARQQMLGTLVEMTRDLGVVPLAEGIETQAEGHLCKQLGFELGQGFLYGKPVCPSTRPETPSTDQS